MKTRTTFDLLSHIDILNNINEQTFEQSPNFVQDTIHILTKLRNRLVNPSIVLKIGSKIATPLHLKVLVDNVAKDIHALVSSDIYSYDRQNYKSVQKIMENRVLEALKNNVAESEATIIYLELCKHIEKSYIQDNIPAIDRVYSIWYCVFFL